MNCSELRQLLLQDPAAQDARAAAHLRQCQACRDFAAGRRPVEQALQQALRVPAPPQLAARVLRAQKRQYRRLPLSLAATAALAVLLVGLLAQPVPGLAAAIAAHVQDERLSADRPDAMPQAKLADRAAFLGGSLRDIAPQPALPVTRVSVCLIGRALTLHFVLQTADAGTMEVVIVPGAKLSGSTALSAGSLSGWLVPARGFGLAVLGHDPARARAEVQQLQSAFDWHLPQSVLKRGLRAAWTWLRFGVLALRQAAGV